MNSQKIRERLSFHNPWWQRHFVPPVLAPAFKRQVYQRLLKYLSLERVIMIRGPRRTGKSTIFYQLIDHLIKEQSVPYQNICYITFDDPLLRADLLEILGVFEKMQGVSLEGNKRIFLFLDEVHFLDNWASLVKILFDRKLNLKILVSGSAASLLVKQSESLAGRTVEETVLPLSFPEWITYFKDRPSPTIADTKETHLESYLQKSGFMHILEVAEKEIWTKMLLEDVVTKAIYKDSVEVFGLREPAVLEKMFSYAASSTAGLTNLTKLASMLGIDRIQTGNYLTFLENTLLVFSLPKYSRQVRETIRSQKKLHLIDQGFAQVYPAARSMVLESVVARHMWEKYPRGTYYWRERQEVDLVVETSTGLLPIEIKSSDHISQEETSGLQSFSRRFGINSGLILYSGEKKEQSTRQLKISFIPVWDFLADMDAYL